MDCVLIVKIRPENRPFSIVTMRGCKHAPVQYLYEWGLRTRVHDFGSNLSTLIVCPVSVVLRSRFRARYYHCKYFVEVQ